MGFLFYYYDGFHHKRIFNRFFPLAQASRIGLKSFDLISQEGRNALSDWYPERQMLDIVGPRRQIFEIIKRSVKALTDVFYLVF